MKSYYQSNNEPQRVQQLPSFEISPNLFKLPQSMKENKENEKPTSLDGIIDAALEILHTPASQIRY